MPISNGRETEFEAIKTNGSQLETASDFIVTQGGDGTQGKILGENISLNIATPTNYTPISANIKGHLKGIDNAISAGGAVLSTLLTGLSASSGTFTSSSSIITAFGKIKYLIDNISTLYQALLVSGTNIKTINGNSLLGSGNLVTPDMDTTTAQDVSGVKTFFDSKFALRNVANTFSILFTNAVTATRTFIYPNKSGTFALLDDIPTNFFSLFPIHYAYQDTGGVVQTIGTLAIAKIGTTTPLTVNLIDYTSLRSSTAINQLVWIRESSYGRILQNFGYYFEERIRNNDASTISDALCFYGLANTQTFTATGNPSTYTGNMIGIGSDATDTNMQFMYKVVSGSVTKIDLGSNFIKTASEDYLIKMWRFQSSNTTYYEIKNLTNSTVVSGSVTHNPTTGTGSVALTIHNFRSNNTSAIACGLAFQRASIYLSDTV